MKDLNLSTVSHLLTGTSSSRCLSPTNMRLTRTLSKTCSLSSTQANLRAQANKTGNLSSKPALNNNNLSHQSQSGLLSKTLPASLIHTVLPQICNRLVLTQMKSTTLVHLNKLARKPQSNHTNQALSLTRDPTSQACTLILTGHTTMSLPIGKHLLNMALSQPHSHKPTSLVSLSKIMHLLGKTLSPMDSNLKPKTATFQIKTLNGATGITLTSLLRTSLSSSLVLSLCNSSPTHLSNKNLLRHLSNLVRTVVHSIIRHLLNNLSRHSLSSSSRNSSLLDRLLLLNMVLNNLKINSPIDLSRLCLIVILRDRPHH
jgi:hypothetical protein